MNDSFSSRVCRLCGNDLIQRTNLLSNAWRKGTIAQNILSWSLLVESEDLVKLILYPPGYLLTSGNKIMRVAASQGVQNALAIPSIPLTCLKIQSATGLRDDYMFLGLFLCIILKGDLLMLKGVCKKEVSFEYDLLGNHGVDASVLALEDTILNEDVAVLEAQRNVGQEVTGIEQGGVTTLLDKQLPNLLTVSNNVLEVLQDDLNGLLVNVIGLGNDLNTSQALNLETSLLKRATRVGGDLVQLLDGDTGRVQNVVILWRQDDGDVGFTTGQQGGVVVEGGGGVDELKDGLDVLEVKSQSDPVGEQGGTLRR